MRPLVSESEFKDALRDLVRNGDVPPEIRAEAELLQSQLASPGEWSAAEHQPPDNPEPLE